MTMHQYLINAAKHNDSCEARSLIQEEIFWIYTYPQAVMCLAALVSFCSSLLWVVGPVI